MGQRLKYALAVTTKDISEKPFDYIKEKVYFGVTNSADRMNAANPAEP